MGYESKPENPPSDQSGPKFDKTDVSAGRFREISPNQAWVPGVIELVFTDPTESGVASWNFAEEKERKESDEAWPEALKNALSANRLESWKPSFPLRYPWKEALSDEEAFEDFRRSGYDKFVTLNFRPDAETRRIADELRELPEIELAVAVPRVGPPSGPLDEPLMGVGDQPVTTVCDINGCLQSQWYIFRCKVDQAWRKKNASGEDISGKGVIIGDIDWGFNPNHQDLRARITKTQNIGLNSVNPSNVANGNRLHHGTAALGIAGAEVNAQGMAGVAFGAELWAIQAGLDDFEDHSRWVDGINFMRSQTDAARKVIILEVETFIGGNIEMVPTIAHEIRLAIADNIVVCVPAGNGIRDAGIGDDTKPIPRTGSILVGATDFAVQANIRGVSNGGCRVVVYAPGDRANDVTCGPLDEGYLPGFGGTSSAVAKVAGAVALMLEMNPTLRPDEVRDILKQSTTSVVDGSNNPVGVLLDAEQAVCEAAKLAGQPC
ncbi:MAG: S8 family peptidase [Pyrinomonadaceae bacterium]